MSTDSCWCAQPRAWCRCKPAEFAPRRRTEACCWLWMWETRTRCWDSIAWRSRSRRRARLQPTAATAGDLVAHWRVTTHRTQTVDEYGVFFVNLFQMHGLAPSQVTHIIISSVVPPVDSTLRQVCETYFHLEPMFVEPGIKTGMPMLIDNPTELGADRLADCIAAYERYGGPCIVVDFGTATKFEVISAKGEYLGGAIAPGLGLSADALFSRAARLSRVDIKRPAKVIGTNTVTHLQSGIYYGYIGLVDGILERIFAELGEQSRR